MQKPRLLMHFIGSISVGNNTSKAKAVTGWMMIYGYVFASKACTLLVEQGCDDSHGPSLTYDISTSVTIAAGTAEPVEIPIYAKYVKVTITNNDGADPATVRAYLNMRAYEG